MKKILFVSSASSVFHMPLRRALESAGFEVYCVDDRDSVLMRVGHPIHRIARRLPRWIKNYVFDRAHRAMSDSILRRAHSIKPDVVFFSKAKNIDIAVLDELRTIATTLNWYPDALNNWPSIRKIAGHYDFFFIFDRSVVDALRAQGYDNMYHLPFCGDVDKNAQWVGRRKYPHAVSFLGSYHPQAYPQRLAILMSIMDLGLEVWGNKEWLYTPLCDRYRGPVLPNVEHIKKIYADSKIVIHIDANTNNPGATGLTMRPFDVTAAGSLLIARDDRAEMTDLFRKGNEYVSFHDELDIRQKVEYYLCHDEERDRIACAGFYRTRSEHTYNDRVQRIFRIIDEHTP